MTAAEANQQAKQLVLVVDDEDIIRDIISEHLGTINVDVLEAKNGEMALDCIRNHDVDLVISDIMMPKLNGVEFLKRFRDEGFNFPFIFITGHASVDSTVQALRLGAFDYLEKPFNLDDIEILIGKALRVSWQKQKLKSSAPSTVEDKVDAEAMEVQDLMQHIKALRSEDTLAVGLDVEEQESESSSGVDELIEPLVTETTSQLVFCEAAIRGLNDPENGAYEVGYLFRVIQSIRMAAEALQLTEISSFANNMEEVYVNFRVHRTQANQRHIEILLSANEMLKNMVEALVGDESGPSASEIEEKLNELKALMK